MTGLPILGITMGDVCGIGPEITVKALCAKKTYEICRPIVVGSVAMAERAVQVVGASLIVNPVKDVGQAKFVYGIIDVFDIPLVPLVDDPPYGKVTEVGGRAAYMAVAEVIRLAMEDKVNATITGPLNKEALNFAGYHYNGHTEIYAKLTGTADYAMMLVDGNLRVVHVSTHVSLREACDMVKKERIYKVIHIADDACKSLGIDRPRIAVAGLNPHSGENGLFGMEEINEIIPAINTAKEDGLCVDGPVPPDTVFSKARGGMYDIVVVMYHDQGHIPLKVVGFTYDEDTKRWNSVSGINVTLGLPIIRVSVDHGTAFGKAGKGTASSLSMENAIYYGAMFAVAKKGLNE